MNKIGKRRRRNFPSTSTEDGSFIDYLNLVRVTESKKMLKKTDKKLYQIAKAVGYDNVSYYCRVFKKWEKMTPEQYRGAVEN